MHSEHTAEGRARGGTSDGDGQRLAAICSLPEWSGRGRHKQWINRDEAGNATRLVVILCHDSHVVTCRSAIANAYECLRAGMRECQFWALTC